MFPLFRANSRTWTLILLLVLVTAKTVSLIADEYVLTRSSDHPTTPIKMLESTELPTLMQVSDGLFVGGTPDGQKAFEQLVKLGVRTIVSVDHALPDVESAKLQGIRYIHLPVGYAGLSKDRIHAIASLLKHEDDGLYVHCHHGRHRAPAVAAAACIAAGILNRDGGRRLLEVAGTSSHYSGLIEAVEASSCLDKDELCVDRFEYPTRAEVPATAARMVQLSYLVEKVSQSDLGESDKTRYAVLIEEQFKELLRLDAVQSEGADYRFRMMDSLRHATLLRKSVPEENQRLAKLHQLRESCNDCHHRYRDR
ncbi:MAG: hypothetical protein AAF802_05630 [Planctomycetota bacterium]